MTTLENRPNTALLVVDAQNGVLEGAHERDAVVANVGRLVEKARQKQVPVVWVQHSDERMARGRDRGPNGMGSAAAGSGHRAHEPLLDVPDGAGTNGRDGRNQGHRLRLQVLNGHVPVTRGVEVVITPIKD